MAYLVYLTVAAWLLISSPASADPFTIGTAILSAIGAGGFYGATAILVGNVVLGAALVGAGLLASMLLTPRIRPPSPSERQANLRQSIGARNRYYGRVKVGGTAAFFENKDGFLHHWMTLNEGLISAIREIWLGDRKVTLDSNGYVQEPEFDEGDDENGKVVRIFFKMGEANQTAPGQLVSAFAPEFTTSHRLRGVANVLAIFQEVDGSEVTEIYPRLNPQVRIVIDASMVKSVRTGATVWSDISADVIYDYLTAVDGAGFAYGPGFAESQVDLASFQAFAALCDQNVPLKAGGTVKRYRYWGGYAMNEEMRAVLPRMLRTCDGDLYMTTQGKIAIRGGQWSPPNFTLDSSRGHIITAEFQKGQQALAAFNELTITYTEPTLDFQETEADPWIDSGNIALRGTVLSEQLDLVDVPHHAQARRLGKIHTMKSNPAWTGRVVTNFFGFNAVGEETVRIVFAPLGIDEVFAIQSMRFLDDLTGVELTVASFPQSIYDWDAELEEGTPPGEPPDTSTPADLDPPDDINVSAAERALGGSGTGTFLLVTWTEPARRALEQEVEYRTAGVGTWVPMTVSDGAGLAESGLVNEGVDYQVRVRTRAPAGTTGDWSTPIVVEATPDTSPPDPVSGLSASPGSGSATLDWTQPSSLNSIGAQVLRNTTNNSSTATLAGTVYGSPGTPAQFTDTGRTPGTYYYWVAAVNGSNFVRSTLEATGPVTIT